MSKRTGETTADRRTGSYSDKLWLWLPVVVVLILGVIGTAVVGQLNPVPDDALVIEVHARQWSWEVTYPDEGVTLKDELFVPVGHPVVLRLTSTDTRHSLWIAGLNVKQDIVPGRTSLLWFTASQAGEYTMICSEYCGSGHADMTGEVTVLQEADYYTWLDSAKNEKGVSTRSK